MRLSVSGCAALLAFAIPLACLGQPASSSSPAPIETAAAPASPAPAEQDAQPAGIFVPAGTSIPIHIVGTLSSGSAKPGDVFSFQVSENVAVYDIVVFRKGAGGQGHVVESDSAGGNGHSGALALAFDFVYSVDGGRVALSDAAQKQAEGDRKGASSTATIVGLATFGLGGLFGHNLAHGKQKTIDDKTSLSAFVADNIHVQSDERAIPVRYDR